MSPLTNKLLEIFTSPKVFIPLVIIAPFKLKSFPIIVPDVFMFCLTYIFPPKETSETTYKLPDVIMFFSTNKLSFNFVLFATNKVPLQQISVNIEVLLDINPLLSISFLLNVTSSLNITD